MIAEDDRRLRRIQATGEAATLLLLLAVAGFAALRIVALGGAA